MEKVRVDKPKAAFAKFKHAAKHLTAQPLKFRVTLSELTAENIGQRGAATAYFAWVRGGKEIATDDAEVEDRKAEWRGELTQVVTIYFQVDEGNLKASKKSYSLKVKDSRTKKTLGKVKFDMRDYCKLESQFNRAFCELNASSGIKIFFVISTELVDEEDEDGFAGSPSPSPVTGSGDPSHRSLSARFHNDRKASLALDEASGSGKNLSASLHDLPSPEAVASPASLIQQSIDILHSSSEEEEESTGWQGKLQAIARKLTPKPTPSHQRRNTAPAIATAAAADPSIKRNLFGEPGPGSSAAPAATTAVEAAPVNPFGAVADDDDGHPARYDAGARDGDERSDSTCASPDLAQQLSKLSQETELLRTQCAQLKSENDLLKQRLQSRDAEREAENSQLQALCDALKCENASLRKERGGGRRGGGGQKPTSPDATAGVAASQAATMVSPRKEDMIEELIATKMKLAQTQSTLDELKRQPSDATP